MTAVHRYTLSSNSAHFSNMQCRSKTILSKLVNMVKSCWDPSFWKAAILKTMSKPGTWPVPVCLQQVLLSRLNVMMQLLPRLNYISSDAGWWCCSHHLALIEPNKLTDVITNDVTRIPGASQAASYICEYNVLMSKSAFAFERRTCWKAQMLDLRLESIVDHLGKSIDPLMELLETLATNADQLLLAGRSLTLLCVPFTQFYMSLLENFVNIVV